MRLFTCFTVYAIVLIINAVHSGQPCAAVRKPNAKQCSGCPAKACPLTKEAETKKIGIQRPALSDERAPKPTAQTGYALFPWDNKIQLLLN